MAKRKSPKRDALEAWIIEKKEFTLGEASKFYKTIGTGLMDYQWEIVRDMCEMVSAGPNGGTGPGAHGSRWRYVSGKKEADIEKKKQERDKAEAQYQDDRRRVEAEAEARAVELWELALKL